jgi:hypothetical protein
MSRSTSAALLLVLALAGAADAQPAAPARKPARLAVATNPLAIPFGLFTLDVETATHTPGLTIGAGGTWITEGHDKRWADARVMYFPGEVALRGFALGLTGGVVSEEGADGERSESAPTLGVRMDYDWLVGVRKRMLVGIGIGVKRVLRDVSDVSSLDQVYADGRFVVGLTF